jgi:drug/metabolite transporter (DMT)-like permease
MPSQKRFAFLALVGASLCWSFSGIFVHFLGKHIGVLTQSTFRYFTAGFVLLILSSVFFRPRMKITARELLWIMLAGLFGLSFQLTWVKALYIIKPGTASLIAEFGTILNIFVLSFFYREERETAKSRLFLLSTLVMLSGVAMVIIFNPRADFEFNLAVFLVVLSSLAWGLYTVVIKRVVRTVNAIVSMSYVAFFISAYHAVCGLFWGNLGEIAGAPARVIGVLVLSGIVSIAGSHSLFYMAIKRVPVVISNNLMLTIPVLACVWSYFIFGEVLMKLQILGGLLLILGGFITSKVKHGPPSGDSH